MGSYNVGIESKNRFTPVFSKRVFKSTVFDCRPINGVGEKMDIVGTHGAMLERARQVNEYQEKASRTRGGFDKFRYTYAHAIGGVREYFESADGVVGWICESKKGYLKKERIVGKSDE